MAKTYATKRLNGIFNPLDWYEPLALGNYQWQYTWRSFPQAPPLPRVRSITRETAIRDPLREVRRAPESEQICNRWNSGNCNTGPYFPPWRRTRHTPGGLRVSQRDQPGLAPNPVAGNT
jgi:hypothetical protein